MGHDVGTDLSWCHRPWWRHRDAVVPQGQRVHPTRLAGWHSTGNELGAPRTGPCPRIRSRGLGIRDRDAAATRAPASRGGPDRPSLVLVVDDRSRGRPPVLDLPRGSVRAGRCDSHRAGFHGLRWHVPREDRESTLRSVTLAVGALGFETWQGGSIGGLVEACS